MVKIYCIEDCDGLKYVGSTIQTLKRRFNQHKCSKTCMSRKLNLDDCRIYTLEECDDNKRKEREQYWINHTACVNKYKVFRNKKEHNKIVKIYCIEDCDGLKYVGSTNDKLNKRLNNHKCSKICMSRELNLNDCNIYTLEECDEEKRKEREQYWIDHTECVNKYNTICDVKEYTKEYNKNYYQKNKDKAKE